VTTVAKQPRATGGDNRMKILEATMKRNQYQGHALIEVLHKAQELFGFLEPDLLRHVARSLKLPLSRVYGVATFYHFFTLKPQGKHSCVVCLGTACYVKGSANLLAAAEHELGIHPGETTANKQVSLSAVRCIGACAIAPAVVIDGEVSGQVQIERLTARLLALVTEEDSTNGSD
jgi:bidirectional [NiFe] hydrogenase diaphorase subunit